MRWWHVRRGLVVALLVSLGVHLALSFVPDELPASDEPPPLMASIKELPPPPEATAPPPPAPAPKPKRPRPVSPLVTSAPEALALPEALPLPEQPAALADAGKAEQEATALDPTATEHGPPVPPAAVAESGVPVKAGPSRKSLPPRVDLAYKVFYGTQGFHIGSATYRFEHDRKRYRIATVGEARGLAALLFRGQGRMESVGVITPDGLRPLEFVVDKFNSRGMERAAFDWTAGIATLFDNTTAELELPTFDLLALMWQFYFQPPEAAQQTFSLATTRRVDRVTLSRERVETIEWVHGKIETEVWHRTSRDGRTDAYVWLAPSLRWIPVKMRVVNTRRGTVEALLDAIRVDETADAIADASNGAPASAPVPPAEAAPAPGSPEAAPAPQAASPEATSPQAAPPEDPPPAAVPDAIDMYKASTP